MKARITTITLTFFAVATFIYPQDNNLLKSDKYRIEKQYSDLASKFLVEGFENDAFPPIGWKSINLDGRYQWNIQNYKTYNGSHSAYIDYDITTCMVNSYKEGKRSLLKINCIDGFIKDTTNNWLIAPRYLVGPKDSLAFYASPYYFTGENNTLSIRVSLFGQIPSDSASIDAAFGAPLLKINLDTVEDKWSKYSISLEQYSGQAIYIGFNNYCVDGTGVSLDDIKIGSQLDIDYSSLFCSVPQFCKTNDKISLEAKFANFGKETKGFYAVCEILQENYKSEKYYENVACENIQNVSFDSLIIMNGGTHDVIFYSKVNGDENMDNDTIYAKFYAVEQFDSPGWHLELDTNKTHGSNGTSSFFKKSGNESIPDTSFLYVIGGPNDSGFPDSVFIYNTFTQKWRAAEFALPEELTNFIPIQIGGKIYIPGGNNTDTHTLSTNLYIYDIREKSITQGNDLFHSAYNYSVGVYGDSLLYYFDDYYTENVQIYNVHTNTWTYGTPSSHGFSTIGSLAGDKIVMIGWKDNDGFTSIGTIDKNDPSNITWSKIGFPGTRFSGATVGSWNGKKNKYVIFAGGTHYGIDYLADVWMYDIVNEKWLYGPDKIYAASFQNNMVPVIRNDSVYMVAVGGFGENNFRGANEWLFIGIDEPENYIGIDEEPNSPMPRQYSLSQNYPNPFNPSTKIKYSLQEPGYVILTVYDMLGREIKTLINEFKNSGEHEVIFNAAGMNLSSGIYLYRIKSGSFVQTKKLMLIK